MRRPGRPDSRPNRGFALVLVVLLLTMVFSLAVGLSLALVNQGQNAVEFESQLSSLVLATNGVEYARCVLPSLFIPALLNGLDGQFQSKEPGWRNPLSLEQARRIRPDQWRPTNDDGIPAWGGVSLLNGACRSEPGYFVLKFSNNVEETPDQDQDGIVVVRSVGIVPERQVLGGGARNSACMVEAVFRQQREFAPQAALSIFGNEGEIVVEGEDCSIEGGSCPAVGVVSTGTLSESLSSLLATLPRDRFSGAGLEPSIRDLTVEYLTSKRRSAVFSPEFWSHFLDNLADFADGDGPGIVVVKGGGQFSGSVRGILVTMGNLDVTGTVDGLLLHLGGGRLSLVGEARIHGAVWMSHAYSHQGQLAHRPLHLRLADSAAIEFDAALADEALSWLPPTQLGWRILFSETAG